MKKTVLLLVVMSLIIGLNSCKKEEDPYRRLFVSEAPEGLAENRFEAYVDIQNLQEAQYVGSYQMMVSEQSYYDQNGLVKIYSSRDVEIYKIKARKYWNWSNGYQYISDYTEEYQVTASVLNQIRQGLKNTEFVICHKRTVSGEDDYLGLGLLIWAVD